MNPINALNALSFFQTNRHDPKAVDVSHVHSRALREGFYKNLAEMEACERIGGTLPLEGCIAMASALEFMALTQCDLVRVESLVVAQSQREAQWNSNGSVKKASMMQLLAEVKFQQGNLIGANDCWIGALKEPSAAIRLWHQADGLYRSGANDQRLWAITEAGVAVSPGDLTWKAWRATACERLGNPLAAHEKFKNFLGGETLQGATPSLYALLAAGFRQDLLMQVLR